MTDLSRRTALRLTGCAVGSVALSSLSGCLDSGSSDGSDGSDDSGDGNDGGNGSDGSVSGSIPDYAQWLVAPSEVDQDHYNFATVDVQTLLQYESSFSADSSMGQFRSATDRLDGVSIEDLTGFHLVAGSLVMVGSYDRETFSTFLTTSGYEESTTYEGYTFYQQGGAGRLTALSDDAIIQVGSIDPQTRATGLIDATAGTVDRYHDVSDDCATLLRTLGTATIVGGQTYDEAAFFDDVVAAGTAWTVSGETTELTAPVVFTDGEADAGAVRDAIDESAFFDDFSGTAVSTDGRAVIATGTVSTADISEFDTPWSGPGGQSRAPQVAFTFDYEESADGAGVVTITQDGGDTVTASQLIVRGTGFTDPPGESPDTTTDGTWAAEGGSTSGELDGNDAVVAGDRITVGVSSDAELSVVWESSTGDSSATLATWEGPDA